MKVLVVIGAAVAAMFAFFAILGWATPRRHEVSGEREIDASREQVYDLVRALEDYPKWRSGVKAMEVLGERYIETSSQGKTPYRIVRDEPPGLFVTEIDDPKLPYGGTWTLEIEDRGGRTWLRITERGEVRNVLFRGMGRLFFPYDKTLRDYLMDAARHFERG